MADESSQRRSRARSPSSWRWLLWAWAILAVPLAWPTLRDPLGGAARLNLAGMSETQILGMTVTYDGNAVEPRPASWREGSTLLLFPDLKRRRQWREREGWPELRISWRTAHGEMSVTQRVGMDSAPVCLFELQLDGVGAPRRLPRGEAVGMNCAHE